MRRFRKASVILACCAKWICVCCVAGILWWSALKQIYYKSRWIGYNIERHGYLMTVYHERIIGLTDNHARALWVPIMVAVGLCALGCILELRTRAKLAAGIVSVWTACVLSVALMCNTYLNISEGAGSTKYWKPMSIQEWLELEGAGEPEETGGGVRREPADNCSSQPSPRNPESGIWGHHTDFRKEIRMVSPDSTSEPATAD